MNLSNLIPALSAQEEKLAAESTEKKVGMKTQGPANYRTMTNGQAKRAAQRDRDRMARKATHRNRRDFLKKQQEEANLRGARNVLLGAVDADHPLHANVVKAMERRYDANLEVDVDVAEAILDGSADAKFGGDA